MEDKKCRICGLADMANLNIFQSNTKLSEKIVAVFPIVLYPSDPLPKHICKKCVNSTSYMYSEIEKALKNQSRWLANVRAVQPDNQYVKVVDSIEGANKQTSQLVSLIAGDELGERTVCSMFNLKTDHLIPPTKKCLTQVEKKLFEEQIRIEKEDKLPDSNCFKESKIVPSQKQSGQVQPSKPPTTAKITQLKSVLELNGCTLTKLKTTTKNDSKSESKRDNSFGEVKIKEEPCEEYSELMQQSSEVDNSPLIQNSVSLPSPQPLQLSEPFRPTECKEEEQNIRCKMCSFRCETVEELAIHQLNHLTISITKLSEKRFLDKRIRRGRLIRVDEKKCIRCLNCWRIFVDNKSILHHWSEGDCDYFCQICGKEFATSPKMLREHIPAAHGISYRSTKILRPPTMMPRKPIKIEKSSPKSESIMKIESSPIKSIKAVKMKSPKSPKGPPRDSLSIKVACNICLKVFANFKARNSHMRAHKHPPFLPAPSLSETLLALNQNDLMKVKDEPLDFESIPYQNVNSQTMSVPSTSNVPAITYPRLKNIPQRTIPAGIRTKNVKARPSSNLIVPKTEPELVPPPPLLQVKSLVDLQDPSVSSQLPEDSDKPPVRIMGPASIMAARNAAALSPAVPLNKTPEINGQNNTAGVVTPKDNMNYSQIFNCHPCGGKFTSKLELFRHKRKCTANNLFPCQFCDRHFLTSADLQMHIMLLHKSSCAQ